MGGKTTPLYVVCSPFRCCGKTLVSRLLCEFYALANRPVMAFDLSDEGPQLRNYLPEFTTIADIHDIHGQMAFFEQLLIENEFVKVVDVSHRTFNEFFTIAKKIGFFAEASHHHVESLILFIVDADPKSIETYIEIRDDLGEASFLPVNNMVPIALPTRDEPKTIRAAPASLEIPLLSFTLRALIDQQHFSFLEFSRTRLGLSEKFDDELRNWVNSVFCQFRDIEYALGYDITLTRIAAAPSGAAPRIIDRSPSRNESERLANPTATHQSINVPLEVLKFAPRKLRNALMDQLDSSSITIHEALLRLQTAKDQIDELESKIKAWQDRATLAEHRLKLVQELIANEKGSVRKGEP